MHFLLHINQQNFGSKFNGQPHLGTYAILSCGNLNNICTTTILVTQALYDNHGTHTLDNSSSLGNTHTEEH